MTHTTAYTNARERALELARSGAYEDWHAVFRKMLFDGWGIEIFSETAFTVELDAVCARTRA